MRITKPESTNLKSQKRDNLEIEWDNREVINLGNGRSRMC